MPPMCNCLQLQARLGLVSFIPSCRDLGTGSITVDDINPQQIGNDGTDKSVFFLRSCSFGVSRMISTDDNSDSTFPCTFELTTQRTVEWHVEISWC